MSRWLPPTFKHAALAQRVSQVVWMTGCGLCVFFVATELFVVQPCSVGSLLRSFSLKKGQNCRMCSGDCSPVGLERSSV